MLRYFERNGYVLTTKNSELLVFTQTIKNRYTEATMIIDVNLNYKTMTSTYIYHDNFNGTRTVSAGPVTLETMKVIMKFLDEVE